MPSNKLDLNPLFFEAKRVLLYELAYSTTLAQSTADELFSSRRQGCIMRLVWDRLRMECFENTLIQQTSSNTLTSQPAPNQSNDIISYLSIKELLAQAMRSLF
jgi:hypothetical protein